MCHRPTDHPTSADVSERIACRAAWLIAVIGRQVGRCSRRLKPVRIQVTRNQKSGPRDPLITRSRPAGSAVHGSQALAVKRERYV